jgi:putrescine transport system permease protein
MKIYSDVRLGVKPEINAVSTILIGIVTVGVIIASYLSRRQTLQEERERRAAAAG